MSIMLRVLLIAMSVISSFYVIWRIRNSKMVVVQGVIDAYFLEGDQVVLMDYKTDRVDQISDLVSRYHVQLDMYAKTIHQLTGRMVTEKIIYAFHFDDSINL